MSLKIVHKALLLIIIPLLLELGFLFKLSLALQSADANIAVQTQVGSALVYVDLILFDVINAASAFVLFTSFKDKTYLQSASASASKLASHKEQLQTLSSHLPSEKSDLEAFISRVDELTELLSQVRSVYEDNGYMSSIKAMGKLKSFMTRVSRAGNLLVERQVQQQGQLEEKHRQDSSRMQTMIAIFAAATLAAALVLGILLSTSFNRRLQILMKNTRRIADSAQLEPRLTGTDELAVLDDVIHNLSGNLAEARRRKEEVLALVSHDLRSPLSSLGLTLELLQSGVLGSLNQRGEPAVANARTTVQSLIGMINDLLEVESLELGGFTLNLERTAIADLAAESVGMVSSAALKKNIEIKVDCGDCSADIDRPRMVRVLVNLLGNAVKFSEAGYKIELSARVLTSEPAATIEMRVCDQGPGIPEDKLATIFEKFQQAGRGDEGEKSGSGLGLAICKAIVIAHGGKIGVENQSTGGSSFWIQFPASHS